jgi:hypothetical protein
MIHVIHFCKGEMTHALDHTVYTVLFIAHFLYIIPGIVWFYLLRDKFPIKQRKPHFVIFAVLCFLMSQQFSNVKLIEPDVNKGAMRILTNLSFFVALHLTALRLFLLYFWELTTRLSVQYYNSESIFSKDYAKKDFVGTIHKWIFMNRSRLNDEFWFKSFALLGLLAFLISCIFVFKNLSVLSDSASIELLEQFDSNSRALVSLYSVLCLVIPLILMLYSLKGFEDNFFIKLEFKCSILVSLINVFCAFLVSWPRTNAVFMSLNITPIISGMIPLFFYVVVSVYLVIYWSYSSQIQFEKQSRKSPSSSIDFSSGSSITVTPRKKSSSHTCDLKQILKNEEARGKFLEFLKKEFSVENMLLYDSCLKFKQMLPGISEQDAWEYACEIFEKFIDPRGPLTVNIADSSRRKLLRIFTSSEQSSDGACTNAVQTSQHEKIQKLKKMPLHISADLFEEVQQEVLNLLAKDSFLRFKQLSVFSPKWITSNSSNSPKHDEEKQNV